MNLPAFSFRPQVAVAWLAVLAFAFLPVTVRAAEVIPKPPTDYFTDAAGVVTPAAADEFNRTLEKFEKDTSNQILVVVYPTMQTDSSLEDYCHRIAASWRVGEKGKNNGAILFVFVAEHRSRIDTGAGLEGALPDARCKDIVADVLAPKFKAGNYEGGLRDGIAAILQSARGEYKGDGRTAAEKPRTSLLDLGSEDHGWTFARVFNLLLFGGLALLILAFPVYAVWQLFIYFVFPKKWHRDNPPPPKVHDHTTYGGHSSGSSGSFGLSDARMVGSAVSGLLSLGGGRGGGGGVFSAAGGLFLGGGASGDW